MYLVRWPATFLTLWHRHPGFLWQQQRRPSSLDVDDVDVVADDASCGAAPPVQLLGPADGCLRDEPLALLASGPPSFRIGAAAAAAAAAAAGTVHP